MNCPQCSRTSPREAARCDCGYDFVNRRPANSTAMRYTAVSVCLICSLVFGGFGAYFVIDSPLRTSDGIGQFFSIVVAFTALAISMAFLFLATYAALRSRK